MRFEDLATRVERTVGGRPGWVAGKVDRWQDGYSAFYVPALGRPWWQRWMRYLFAPDGRSRMVVKVERGYLKRNSAAPTPSGHWASLKIVAFSGSKGVSYVDPFQTWYPDRSSGW